jgi:hypothetical protein
MMPSIWTRRRVIGAGAVAAVTLPVAPRSAAAAPAQGGALFTLATPVRVYDSRLAGSVLGGRKLIAGDSVAVIVNVWEPEITQASSVFANVTVTATEGAGFLTVTPEDLSGEQPIPNTSNINWSAPNVTLANLALVQVGGENSIVIHCRGAGLAHVIVDIQGFVPFPG